MGLARDRNLSGGADERSRGVVCHCCSDCCPALPLPLTPPPSVAFEVGAGEGRVGRGGREDGKSLNGGGGIA
jgi:hypothetical protein